MLGCSLTPEHLQAAARDQEASLQLAGDLEVDCDSAAGRLQEAFRGLLFVALLQGQSRPA